MQPTCLSLKERLILGYLRLLLDFFEFDHLRSALSVYVIRKLKADFAHHGIPEQLVTVNGLQFTSRDFLRFTEEWDFERLMSSPHHSQGNSKAESAVKESKKIVRKCRASGSDTFLDLLTIRRLRVSKLV